MERPDAIRHRPCIELPIDRFARTAAPDPHRHSRLTFNQSIHMHSMGEEAEESDRGTFQPEEARPDFCAADIVSLMAPRGKKAFVPERKRDFRHRDTTLVRAIQSSSNGDDLGIDREAVTEASKVLHEIAAHESNANPITVERAARRIERSRQRMRSLIPTATPFREALFRRRYGNFDQRAAKTARHRRDTSVPAPLRAQSMHPKLVHRPVITDGSGMIIAVKMLALSVSRARAACRCSQVTSRSGCGYRLEIVSHLST
jgi:hypothetical protein